MSNTTANGGVGQVPNKAEAERHLELLDPFTNQFTFQIYHDSLKPPESDSFLAKLHGTLEQHWTHMVAANKLGCGIFVSVQETNLRGRTLADIVRVRALFRELDQPAINAPPIAPHFTVESSPDKFHEYYLVSGLPLAEFRGIQQRMVDDYGSDPQAKDAARVLRLAGFNHLKNPAAPFMVRIVQETGHGPYSADQIRTSIPPVFRQHAAHVDKPRGTYTKEQILALLERISPSGPRDVWVNTMMGVHYENPDLLYEINNWSSGGGNYIGFHDVQAVWDSFGKNNTSDPVTMASVERRARLEDAENFDWAAELAVIAAAQAPQQPAQPQGSALSRLKGLSVVPLLDEMEKNMKADNFIFEGMALEGQISLFFAKHNVGKTLIFLALLIKGIKDGRIDPKKVIYLNADDNFKGIQVKGRIAEKHGFHMVSPDVVRKSPKEVMDMIDEITAAGDAKGYILILDTFKKFSNMMDKTAQKETFNKLRSFANQNATVILAGHTNKKFDKTEGKYMYEGTADTMNDLDCAYYMKTLSDDDGTHVVEFELEKCRGNMVESAAYSYQKRDGLDYEGMVSSVGKVGEADTKAFRELGEVNELREEYASEILHINRAIGLGLKYKTEIVKAAFGLPDRPKSVSRNRLSKVLDETALHGKVWDVEMGASVFTGVSYSIIQ